MLIYEYMHNRSLDTFIFDEGKRSLLSWQNRFAIILGIVRGLLYLHQDSRFRIIHRDLKAANVLLDREMNPKISDFGTARVFGDDQTDAHTRKVVGTFGYMSPEYAMDGILSIKLDVFSFGVLVLEIISGKRNKGFYQSEPQSNLITYAWKLWKEGKSFELLDESLEDLHNISEVLRCIQVALLCVQEQPRDRPMMSSVTMMLASENATLAEPKEPGFSTGRGSIDIITSRHSVNYITVTTEYHRNKQVKAMKAWPLSLLFLCSLLSPSIAGDTITPSTPLSDGETLVSAGGNFELGFFSRGNSKNKYLGIWYKNISTHTVVWVANREAPLTDRTGSLNISSDGNLILSNQTAKVFWSTNSSKASSPVAQLLDTGNFVLKEGNSDSYSFLWQSFDYPCDTLLPGMKLGLDLTTGLDRYLTTWKSTDDPSPGDYSFKLDPHGSPEFFIWKGSTKEYRNGPWNGIRFSGEPEMDSDSYFTFEFVDNSHEIYYMYQVADSSIISRFMLNQSMIQRYVWFNSTLGWSLYWSMPRDQCDYYAQCGPYGICNSNDSPICNCIHGFDPKSPQNWNLRDGRDGCVRKTRLDCQGDGFLKLTDVKLPDTSNSTVNESMSLEQCRESCLNNCSCVAYAAANISGGGSGCIIWGSNLIDIKQFVDGGQDLYVRLAASELNTSSNGGDQNKKKHATVIIVICITSGLLLLVSSGCYIWHKKFRKHSIKLGGRRQLSIDLALTALGPTQDHHPENEGNRGKELELPLFELSTIVIATDDFSIANKLGEGGFGAVYKGELEDGQGIAVKRLSRHSRQGTDEFKNEVMLIAKLQHVNLVRLLGCCMHGEDRMLIYEYMHNRSLDTIIFDKTKCALLTWQKRFNIIVGIARGLLYLHQDSRFRIIHRDLKASNVLLDKDMNPKISDFGVARIFGGDQSDAYTKRVVGTYGYMSPEYAMDGIFSVKSDVFSFGVLVLEIISGKKNRGIYSTEPNLNLLSHAWKLWKEGNSLELLDKSVGCSYSINEVLRCIQVGLLCVQDRAEDRPHMSTVILMLGSASAMLPLPKQPGYCSERSATDTEWSSSCTVNEITVTMLSGR
ncbi:receptor-like serine/threonine-protein kinase SD1-8 [Phoenix dactylifera]|uniref:Receptor-like serine/threonine-protein kinase SD1-8 n=1 Tax=Phoenix dactylifera TaxID=42345 RepID=A0A8B9A121_PHODC|nr:receptor-like serine/threonine-protein kinase SD1-8 [Phoenix dactylifera]